MGVLIHEYVLAVFTVSAVSDKFEHTFMSSVKQW